MRQLLSCFALVAIIAVSVSASAQTERFCETMTFEACGGDVLGTWTYESACLNFDNAASLIPGCDGATIDPTVDVTGTITFNPDLTYTSAEAVNTTVVMSIPLTCLPEEVTCEMMGQGQAVENTGTHCVITQVEQENDNETGTYIVDGTSIRLVQPDDPGQVASFCVTDNRLAVSLADEGFSVVLTVTR